VRAGCCWAPDRTLRVLLRVGKRARARACVKVGVELGAASNAQGVKHLLDTQLEGLHTLVVQQYRF